MKTTAFRLILLFQIFPLFCFAQKNAGLKALLNKNAEFIFPQTPDKISAILGVKTIFYEDANEQPYAKWLTRSGLELYCSLGDDKSIEEMFFIIPEDQPIEVEGLPFNLVMNRTTPQQSTLKFSRYKIKKEKLGEDGEYPGGMKLFFKRGDRFITLLFDRKNLLKFLSITNEIIGSSVN
ncbi:hypothetical protein [Pedobacter alluvionis]|uniref:Uncharacterized protein n=1 Tax=Pedobacter alluvionis TaxID=475253 RepID=A0A497YB68_9SPHI|nr:hypothetical protein [Pedobacter alluvionis]RLJ80813.1 hypothetical protein BCL90_1614 [Pedobacter alluvionis]TFB32055.1 hypothetical protein E3V97_15965 [Pedobacter alluvionis]